MWRDVHCNWVQTSLFPVDNASRSSSFDKNMMSVGQWRHNWMTSLPLGHVTYCRCCVRREDAQPGQQCTDVWTNTSQSMQKRDSHVTQRDAYGSGNRRCTMTSRHHVNINRVNNTRTGQAGMDQYCKYTARRLSSCKWGHLIKLMQHIGATPPPCFAAANFASLLSNNSCD